MTLKHIVDVMALFGIPSIFAMMIFVIKLVYTYIKQIRILMKSQQAQMRSHLLELYDKYIDRGWISEDELLDWENQYQAYHSLGQNGILDAKRQQVLALPNKRKEASDDIQK